MIKNAFCIQYMHIRGGFQVVWEYWKKGVALQPGAPFTNMV